jgi:hypothetical protein
MEIHKAEIRTTPTADDPLRGLTILPGIALVGRARIKAKADEQFVYTWKDIAIVSTIIMLAGGPSGGKTTLLFLILAARMNTGNPVPVLGHEVTPAPLGQFVVLVEAEHGEASAARKLVRSCSLLGVDEAALDRVIIIARKSVLVGSDGWKEIEAMVRAGLVSDIALDTLARTAPADANNEQEQAAIFETIAKTIEIAPKGREPMIWICAHTRKGGTGSGDDVSGSAQRVAQVDSLLLVEGEKIGGQTVSSKVTFWKLREDPDVYPQPVTFAIRKGPAGESVHVDGVVTTEDKRPLKERIASLLGTGAKTKAALAKATGRSNADVDVALGELFGERRITTTEIKVRGKSCKAYMLRPGGPLNGASHDPEAAAESAALEALAAEEERQREEAMS